MTTTWDDIAYEAHVSERVAAWEEECAGAMSRCERLLAANEGLLGDALRTAVDLVMAEPPDIRPDSDDPSARQAFEFLEATKQCVELAGELRSLMRGPQF